MEKIFNKIKTFEDACKESGITEDQVFSTTDTPDEKAYKKLKQIIKVINEGWVPDWNNSNQRKWYPWFYLSSGFGFSYSFYSCDYTDSSVGSRLCFETEEKCDYVAKQFIEIYEEFLTIKS